MTSYPSPKEQRTPQGKQNSLLDAHLPHVLESHFRARGALSKVCVSPATRKAKWMVAVRNAQPRGRLWALRNLFIVHSVHLPSFHTSIERGVSRFQGPKNGNVSPNSLITFLGSPCKYYLSYVDLIKIEVLGTLGPLEPDFRESTLWRRSIARNFGKFPLPIMCAKELKRRY